MQRTAHSPIALQHFLPYNATLDRALWQCAFNCNVGHQSGIMKLYMLPFFAYTEKTFGKAN